MTTTRIRNALLLLIVLATGALIVLFLRSRALDGVVSYGDDTQIEVSVADTPALREEGLSGTNRLPEGVGKLFVFDTPGMYGFWMKDMQYSIDIVWIDAAWQVVGVTPGLAPETYPTIFYPPKAVLYVLEVPEGSTGVDKLTVGTQLTWTAR